ncbi:MAG TPA: hypothetical protein VEX40_03140, partial [Mycobacterium sp.]|nr:hypothetical protein [Mycobacterium sp.]
TNFTSINVIDQLTDNYLGHDSSLSAPLLTSNNTSKTEMPLPTFDYHYLTRIKWELRAGA